MGFYPPRACPQLGNSTLGLIRWHSWPFLVPGVLQSWENSFFPHHTALLGFIRALPSHQTLPGRIPLCGKPLCPPDHAAFLPPGCPFPSIISRRMFICGKFSPQLFPLLVAYPGHFATPPLFVPSCMHLFIANIFNLKNVLSQKMQIKIWADSLHKLLFIPLATAQFPAKLAPEFTLYNQFCRGATNHVTGICRQRWVNEKLGVAGPLFPFLINYITSII